jgi:hypothetical protein
MKRNELRKLMDCCRPDSEDLAEPEMSALAKSLDQDPGAREELMAIQAWDAKITSAMRDVPVPTGLADRLLEATAQAERKTADEVDSQVNDETEGPIAEPARMPAGRWRKIWAAGVAASLVAAAVLVAFVAWYAGWRDNLTSAQVAEWARQWSQDLDLARWERNEAFPQAYPVEGSLRIQPVAWQRFQALNDSQAVAYLLNVPPDRSSAYLLVIRTHKGRQLPGFPSSRPDSTTGNLCVGVWKSNGCLYALVVPGSETDYRRVLKSQAFVVHPAPADPPVAV